MSRRDAVEVESAVKHALAITILVLAASGPVEAQTSKRVTGRIHICVPPTSDEGFEMGIQFSSVFSAFERASEVDLAKDLEIDSGKCADADAYADIDNPRLAPRRGDKYDRSLGSGFGKDLGTATATVITDFKSSR
jgi:hypothetical protein